MRSGLGNVLVAVLAEVGQRERAAEQVCSLAREHDLTSVGASHDPGGAVDVEADVLGWIEPRPARVDADADPDWDRVERDDGLGGPR